MILAFAVFLLLILVTLMGVSLSTVYEKATLTVQLKYLFFKKIWVIKKIDHVLALEIEKNEKKTVINLSDVLAKKTEKKTKRNFKFLIRIIKKIDLQVKKLYVGIGGDDAYDIAIKTGFVKSVTGVFFAITNANVINAEIAPRFGKTQSIVVINCIFKTAMVNIIYAYIIFKAKAVIKCIQSKTYFKRP